ncbi:MAG: aminotransferase class V-fold PLP-dependent enzyme, partial [Atopobiaceae bacterium]|nr:aminotransferase class V-fold PLP-dependent enzyme [Atopobiaceae bacterium]
IRQIADVVARERQRRLEAGEARPLYLHTDASQAACTHAINVSALRADLVTLSAAKVYGPKQVGLLWAADGVRLRPLVHGGGQESGVRSGTENVAGAVAFARAFQLASELRTSESKRLTKLRDRLQRSLTEDFPWMVVSGPRNASRRLPGLLSVSFPGLEARRLVVLLERRGVSVGTGSACAASRMKVSHVLFAIGLSSEAAAGSLRLTLGRPTTEDDIAYAAQAIASVVRDECARVGLDARTGERA